MLFSENYIITREKQLYTNNSVSDKYTILEDIRLVLDNMYEIDRAKYERCKSIIKPNTWDALEDAWKLWNPAPKNTGSWGGVRNMTFTLDKRSSYFIDCMRKNFIQCTYDEHGSPNFDKVTYPGSIVDISDLYDVMSIEQIVKRGGSRNSLQEIAQDRISYRLENVVRAWAERNRVTYDSYNSFYKWRDENDLVPHEDTNCKTMRLVSRPAHKAFTHRGGISNAKNIKNHFSI